MVASGSIRDRKTVSRRSRLEGGRIGYDEGKGKFLSGQILEKSVSLVRGASRRENCNNGDRGWTKGEEVGRSVCCNCGKFTGKEVAGGRGKGSGNFILTYKYFFRENFHFSRYLHRMKAERAKF